MPEITEPLPDLVRGALVLFLAIGAGILFLSARLVLEHLRFQREAVRLDGTVVSVKESIVNGTTQDGGRRTLYQPTFSYVGPTGETLSAELADPAEHLNWHPGTVRTIMVHRDGLGEARLPGHGRLTSAAIMAVVGAGFIAMPLILILG